MAAFLKRLWTLCLLPTAMLTSLLRRMCNLRTFLKLGVPEASKSFLRRASGGVAAIDMLHFGRVFFVKK